MKKKVFILLILLGVFLFLLTFNMILTPITMDEVWSYGFTNNLYKGLIPYRDFNMIVPPLFIWIMVLPFYLFGSSMLLFHIENALLLTGMMVILYQLIGKKLLLVIPFFFFPHNLLLPDYNILAFLLFFLVLYFEKEQKSDYVIGFVLGLILLTKQTIGICMLLPSLYYWKEKKKIKNRMIGCFIPCMIFLVYLLITHTINQFIDLGILGLLDFGSSNQKAFSIFFFILCILLGLLIYLLKKKPNISLYYLLSFISVAIPLFDFYHSWLFIMAYFVVVISMIEIKKKQIYWIASAFLLIFFVFSLSRVDFSKGVYPNSLNHFEYRYLEKDYVETVKKYNQELKEYKNYVIIGKDAYLHKLTLNQKINKLDLLNNGNFGYHGHEKLLKLIEKQEKDTVYLISKSEIENKTTQIDQKLITYIIEKGEFIKEDKYYVYYFLK